MSTFGCEVPGRSVSILTLCMLGCMMQEARSPVAADSLQHPEKFHPPRGRGAVLWGCFRLTAPFTRRGRWSANMLRHHQGRGITAGWRWQVRGRRTNTRHVLAAALTLVLVSVLAWACRRQRNMVQVGRVRPRVSFREAPPTPKSSWTSVG